MEPTLQQPHKTNWLIPISIVIAGLLVAGALFITRKPADNGGLANPPQGQNLEENMIPVSANDHILGDPNAKIKIVEYSDTECPFCKTFHPTLHKIIDEYGKSGKVAWVYRHFPLYKGTAQNPPLHSKAGKEAEATECVAELGGNTKFWAFLDMIYTNTPANNGLDLAQLPIYAEKVGVNKQAFQTCLDSGKYAEKISRDYDNAIKAGAQGTPYTIIVTPTMKIPINNGAIPYESLKSAIESILASNQ